ncbi:MAG TPA: hypothetical protein VHD56_12390 [Tepidisphaeraceae bacterium]|nr:hypothetical protein [Tepidisphaeraceae bacterium]
MFVGKISSGVCTAGVETTRRVRRLVVFFTIFLTGFFIAFERDVLDLIVFFLAGLTDFFDFFFAMLGSLLANDMTGDCRAARYTATKIDLFQSD